MRYSTAVDVWSVGCIMAELLTNKVLFPGVGEFDQMSRIWQLLGTPNEQVWPGYKKLGNCEKVGPGFRALGLLGGPGSGGFQGCGHQAQPVCCACAHGSRLHWTQSGRP